MVVDVVTLACVSICRRPPNKKWIFGYGKIETVLSFSSIFTLQMSCLAVGSLLIATAGGVFMHISIMSVAF